MVDGGSAAEAATGEGAEVDRDPVFKQKRAESARDANHLAAVVDAQSLVVVVSRTGRRGELNHHPIVNQNSEFELDRSAPKPGDLAVIVNAPPAAEGAIV